MSLFLSMIFTYFKCGVSSSSSSVAQYAPEDQDRRKRRRERNKVAAAKCRNKKKEKTDGLQQVEKERNQPLSSVYFMAQRGNNEP